MCQCCLNLAMLHKWSTMYSGQHCTELVKQEFPQARARASVLVNDAGALPRNNRKERGENNGDYCSCNTIVVPAIQLFFLQYNSCSSNTTTLFSKFGQLPKLLMGHRTENSWYRGLILILSSQQPSALVCKIHNTCYSICMDGGIQTSKREVQGNVSVSDTSQPIIHKGRWPTNCFRPVVYYGQVAQRAIQILVS